MKKLLLALCVLGTAVAAFGQGQIVSNNGASTAITNTSTGLRAVTTTIVGFYVNNNTSATTGDSGWVLAGGTTNLISPGIFVGGTRTYAGTPAGTPVAVQVRAWLSATPFASYEDALAARPGDLHFGSSSVMVINPQVSPSPIPTFASSGLQPFTIAPVPEPSSIALGLLGLGAVALFRRRK